MSEHRSVDSWTYLPPETPTRWQGGVAVGRAFPPLADGHPLVGELCLCCRKPFLKGHVTTIVPLGPGDDQDAREKAARGGWYASSGVPVHYACATGTES